MTKKRVSFWRSLLKKLHYSFWLAMLTFFLVALVIPVVVHPPNKAIAQTTNNAASLLETGKSYYQAGQFSEAASAWQQAAQSYQRQEDSLKLALTLSYLSLAYQALGRWEEAETAIAKSQQLSQRAENDNSLSAQILNVKGNFLLARGQTEAALRTWQAAEEQYQQAGDETGKLGSQINQAQALQNLGLYRRSHLLLERVGQQLRSQHDSALKATGLRSLGMALQVTGKLKQAREVLHESLQVSQKMGDRDAMGTTWFILGNTVKAAGDNQAAIDFYHQAATNVVDPLSQVEARLNQFALLIEIQQQLEAQALLPLLKPQIVALAPSRRGIYAQVNFVDNLLKLKGTTSTTETAKLLASAVGAARKLNDLRAESYALGTLGKIYISTQQWTDAQALTEQALQKAQAIKASEIAYEWQWQLARILEAENDLQGAIAANKEAVNNLQAVRSDLVAVNPDIQFSFRENVEPIYRNLVKLLLTSPDKTTKPSQENLKQARDAIESLRQAELENFFREACLVARPQPIDAIDRKAAVIYPIVLSDRLAVILSTSERSLEYYETQLPQQEIETTLEELLQSLNPAFSNQIRLNLSQKVYDWTIRPLEPTLEREKIETLVFVLDGWLRNIPMAALYDGKQYLIEKYRVALTPGLQLLEAQELDRERLTAVTAGVSQANGGFSALPGVKVELAEIAGELPTAQLLDKQFTRLNFEEQIARNLSPVVHLATHGQFSSNPDETFILAWDAPIRVGEFQNLLRSRDRSEANPVELLVLSACQTAAGDKQATLGLAGMAVRSGARSTIATLWAVKDESTALLMTEFYKELMKSPLATSSRLNRAEALRQAQLALVRSPQFKHPFYWAAFVLVGNWL
jgi:CHAT domain-containing protein